MAERKTAKLPIPALATTAYTAKQPKKRKSDFSKRESKRESDNKRNKTRVNIGEAFQRWREVRDGIGLTLDSELAILLLDCYEKIEVTSSPHKVSDRMCSVVGCDSDRRSAQRFKLPEDPERRLEWVQFLAAANKQRFKESSWTDITICSEHFKDDCFEKPTPTNAGVTGEVQLRLNLSAVPSLGLQSQEPETHLESPKHVKPEETTEVDQHGPAFISEESRLTSMAGEGSPVPSDAFISVPGQMQPKNMNLDLIREKAALLHMKEKCMVNEKQLLQLFNHKCPSCGSKVKTEKVTCGVVLILNQQCPDCDYRNQWKSQVSASVPTAEDQHPTNAAEIKTETQQAEVTGDPEIVAVINEEMDDSMDESSDQEDLDSDEDWKPKKGSFHAEDENGGQLCTECGKFFNNQRRHTCEHKIKPYSCNICGKRCASESALNTHSRVHDEKYEYRCKYCELTFKTKVAKRTHEQSHLTQGKPYKCPDCSETFTTYQQRKIHLKEHRGPEQLKCHICGIEFLWPLCLQRHLSVHTGVKPFKCSVCQRGFSQASHLKSHMRLHTGERPFKCQHCDERFNHNVSLKSHVQRYHSSGSEKKEKINESDTGNDQENWNKRGSSSGLDNVEEEHDKEEEVNKERDDTPKWKRRSTGRPKGRPKSYEAGNSVEGQCSNTKTVKMQVQKSKRTKCSNEESEDKHSDSFTSFDSAEEEEESSQKAMKNTARSRGKNCDSDSDFDPADRRKKKYSSGKRGGRARKNIKEES